MNIAVENLSFAYGEREILKDINFSVSPGGLTFLLGANGSGKSTLLKLLCGLLSPRQGKILLDGRVLNNFSLAERAKHIGVMLQKNAPALDFTAEEFVLFGRNAKLSRLAPPGENDFEAVRQSLCAVGMENFASRKANTLSGGEFQRLALAASLALESEILLLDEPTSAQDPAQAAMVLEKLQLHAQNKSILIISHDLQLARYFARRVLLLEGGRIFASGTPEECLTSQNLTRLYGMPLPEFFHSQSSLS